MLQASVVRGRDYEATAAITNVRISEVAGQNAVRAWAECIDVCCSRSCNADQDQSKS